MLWQWKLEGTVKDNLSQDNVERDVGVENGRDEIPIYPPGDHSGGVPDPSENPLVNEISKATQPQTYPDLFLACEEERDRERGSGSGCKSQGENHEQISHQKFLHMQRI